MGIYDTLDSASASASEQRRFGLKKSLLTMVAILGALICFTFGYAILELHLFALTGTATDNYVLESGESKGRNSSASGDNTTGNNTKIVSNSSNSDDGSSTDIEATEVEAQPILTLMVMLSGEFGNNMFKILRGWGTAKLALRDFGLNTKLVFSQQDLHGKTIGKAISAEKHLKRCFLSPSYFRTVDFNLGNKLRKGRYFHEILSIPGRPNFSLSDDFATIEDIKDNLKILSDYLNSHPDLLAKNNEKHKNQPPTYVPRLMVRVNSLDILNIVDEFYEDIRETFVFDDEECCGETLEFPPSKDESVLHLRNYAVEMKAYTRKRKGFEELNATRIASELLGHLHIGNKLAITGRNLEHDSENNTTEAYQIVQALHTKNLTLRFSPDHNDAMADFCFLRYSQKELIGTSMSTYAMLAGILGIRSMKVVRMYQYVTPELKKFLHRWRLELFRRTVGNNWTLPQLRSKFMFEEYY